MEGTKRPAAGPVWAREREGKRRVLTRAAIVGAAVRLADTEGLDAVSIRRVADELGVRPMSLYTHIERKEDLLELMMDETVAEVIVDEPLPTGWRTAITLIARRSRESLLGHPWLVELLGRRTSIGPNGLRHAEQSLAALDGLGVDSRSAVAVVMAVDDFTLGHTVREVSGREASRRDGISQEEHLRLLRSYRRQLVEGGDHPRLATALAASDGDFGQIGDESFERGLTWLLDGIERELAAGRG